MIYGYARVSTAGQKQNGNSLQDQVEQLQARGAEKIFSDAFTGKTVNRPEFTKLLQLLQEGDTLICTKLDRFARSAVEGAQLVQDLLSKGITVDILNVGRIDNSSVGKLLVQVLLSFAEFERNQIIERTQAGRKIAMDNGKIMGRPKKYSSEKMDLAMELLDQGKSYTTVERMTGISKSTLIRQKKGSAEA